MTLLSPLALLWLGSIPILLWLWRLASTRRQVKVPSLVPFANLLRRQPRRRTRLFINLLFWFQLAALILLALTLARPVFMRPSKKTVLVVVDTSASMDARIGGSSAFAQSIRRLRRELGRKPPGYEWFIMTAAPVQSLMREPTADSAALKQAIESLEVSHLSGNLIAASHIGRALLEGVVDETLIVTDEISPDHLTSEAVRILTVGEALPNVAIVGLDASGELCQSAPPRIAVTLENFSPTQTNVRVTASRGRLVLSEAEVILEPEGRMDVSLKIPEETEGWVEVALAADGDALEVDNHAQVLMRRQSALPVALVSERHALREIMGEWLSACEGILWTDGIPESTGGSYVVVTDSLGSFGPAAVGTLRWRGMHQSLRVVLAHWMVAGEHPIGSYLADVEPVAASLGQTQGIGITGEPIVWGLVEGKKVPIVLASSYDGNRMVSFFLDPARSPSSTSLIVLFFNSLRWLMGGADIVRTGEPLSVPSISPGTIRVERPDGLTERLTHAGGIFRYDATTRAGTYRIMRGRTEFIRVVNFLDPLESNLMSRTSSWRPFPEEPKKDSSVRQTIHPLANILMLVILLCLLGEWWLYTTGRR